MRKGGWVEGSKENVVLIEKKRERLYRLSRIESNEGIKIVLSNQYRYTLNDFWTDNMRISVEAKDNGPTNFMYQQRLNSLQ